MIDCISDLSLYIEIVEGGLGLAIRLRGARRQTRGQPAVENQHKGSVKL